MMNSEDYSPLLDNKSAGEVELYADYRDDLEQLLGVKLTELFDPAVPFAQCRDTLPCRYCDFNEICRR